MPNSIFVPEADAGDVWYPVADGLKEMLRLMVDSPTELRRIIDAKTNQPVIEFKNVKGDTCRIPMQVTT